MAEVGYFKRKEPIKNFYEISSSISAKCEGVGVIANPVGKDAFVICIEKYFFRNSSYAALTVILENVSGGSKASVVGYGGGEGLFNISLGANLDFADMAAEVLVTEFGFTSTNRGSRIDDI